MIDLKISHGSRTPKYKQIINAIEQLIEKGDLKIGDKIPSINVVAETYILSRDTVEIAYNHLKESKIITSVKGVGYFVANTDIETKLHVCLIFNKLSPYKRIIYDSIVKGLGDNAAVDLFIHHCDPKTFENLILKTKNQYTFYVIMPHFDELDQEVVQILNNIPEGHLILLDKFIGRINLKSYGTVYQDFENNIMDVLKLRLKKIKKYEQVYLVFPVDQEHPYPKEIIRGFTRFCAMNNISFKVINEIDIARKIKKGDLYIVIDETDLVGLIKKCKSEKLALGKQVGLISYNDTPLKEILEDGITVISTDFEFMGKETAKMILNNDLKELQSPFRIIERNSF